MQAGEPGHNSRAATLSLSPLLTLFATGRPVSTHGAGCRLPTITNPREEGGRGEGGLCDEVAWRACVPGMAWVGPRVVEHVRQSKTRVSEVAVRAR